MKSSERVIERLTKGEKGQHSHFKSGKTNLPRKCDRTAYQSCNPI